MTDDLHPHSAARADLDQTLRLVGVTLLLAAVTPVASRWGHLTFLPGLLPDLTPGEVVGALLPHLIGLALLGLSALRSLHRLGVAAATLGLTGLLLASAALCPQAFKPMLLHLGDELARHPTAFLTATLALTAGGAVATVERAQKAARVLFATGWLAALIWLLLPERGSPLVVFFALRLVEALRSDPGAVIVVWARSLPLAALLALICLSIPAFLGRALAARATLAWGVMALPIALLLNAWFALPAVGVAPTLLLILRALALTVAALALNARAAHALAAHLLDQHLPDAEHPSTLARDALLLDALDALDADDPRPLPDALASAPPLRRAHPAARWLALDRLRELLAELRLPPAPPARTTRDTARAGLHAIAATRRPLTTRAALAFARRPLPELSALASAALILAATLALTSAPPKGVAAWRLDPPNANADALFQRDLPDYVIARIERNNSLKRQDGGAEAAVRLRELEQSLKRRSSTISPDLQDALLDFTGEVYALDVSSRAWVDHIEAINGAIRDQNLPYYVDADAWEINHPNGDTSRFLYLKTFRVQHVQRVAVGGDTFAALHLRRLDGLNLRAPVLGLSRDHQPFALVLLDEIDGYLGRLLPSLVLDPPRCAPAEDDEPAWRRDLEAECGGRLRAALRALIDGLPDADRRRLDQALDALAARTNALYDLRPHIPELSFTLSSPISLIFSDAELATLDRLTPAAQSDRLEDLRRHNAHLRDLGAAAFQPLTDVLIAATERHELQHQIDGPDLPVPDALYDMMPRYGDDAVGRASREASGYLVELTLDDLHAEFVLAHLLIFLRGLDPSSAEHFAAALILQALTGTDPLHDDGRTDPDALLEAYTRLGALPRAERQRRARQAWEDLYDAPFPELVTTP